MRDRGKEYKRLRTGEVVPAKVFKKRFSDEECRKKGRKCNLFSEEGRKIIFENYYALGSVTRQREFIIRHMYYPHRELRKMRISARNKLTSTV